MSKRNPKVFGEWGVNGTRVLASKKMWDEPIDWHFKAAKSGNRHLVFCASLADVFDDWPGHVTHSWKDTGDWGDRLTLDIVRLWLFDLIHKTTNLTWLLLTKRPENIAPILKRAADQWLSYEFIDLRRMLYRWLDGYPPSNVWLGTTAENQEWADKRIPILLSTPAKVRFVSYEPAIGPVDWEPFLTQQAYGSSAGKRGGPGGQTITAGQPSISWLIVGGESGPRARPFWVSWARRAIRECKLAGVPVFMKQMGAKPIEVYGHAVGIDHRLVEGRLRQGVLDPRDEIEPLALKHKAGADPSEWPAEFRVQEFPA